MIYSGGYGDVNGLPLDRNAGGIQTTLGAINTAENTIKKIFKGKKGTDNDYQKWSMYQDTDGYLRAFGCTGNSSYSYTSMIDLCSNGDVWYGTGVSTDNKTIGIKITKDNNNVLSFIEVNITSIVANYHLPSDIKAIGTYYGRTGNAYLYSDGYRVSWWHVAGSNDDIFNRLTYDGIVNLADVDGITGYGEDGNAAVALLHTTSNGLYGAKRKKFGSGYIFNCPSSWSNDFVPYHILSNVVEYDLAWEAAVAITTTGDLYIWGAHSNYIRTQQIDYGQTGYVLSYVGTGYAHCAASCGTYNRDYPTCWLTDTAGHLYSSGSGDKGLLLNGSTADRFYTDPELLSQYTETFGEIVGGSAVFVKTVSLIQHMNIYDNKGLVQVGRLDYMPYNGVKEITLINDNLPGIIKAKFQDDTETMSGIGYYPLIGADWLGLTDTVNSSNVVYQKNTTYNVNITQSIDLYLVCSIEADNYVRILDDDTGDVIAVIGFSGDTEGIGITGDGLISIITDNEDGLGDVNNGYTVSGLSETQGGPIVYPSGATTPVSKTGNYDLYVVYSNTPLPGDTDLYGAFYNNVAPENKIDKTLDLTVWCPPIKGTLRDACSLIRPHIVFEFDRYPAFNYAYINIFDRYYYVEDKIAVSDKLYEILFRVDPIMSFKREILNQEVLLKRTEDSSGWNKAITDERNPVLKTSTMTVSSFTADTTDDTAHLTKFHPGNANHGEYKFLLHVFNDKMDTQPYQGTGVEYFQTYNTPQGSMYLMDYAEIQGFAKRLSDGDISGLTNLFGADDKSKYIISVRVYPFDFAKLGANKIVGAYDGPVSTMQVGNASIAYGYLYSWFPIDPWIKPYSYAFPTVQSYEDAAPFKKYKIYIPYCGTLEVDPMVVSGKTIWTKYIIDFTTGYCKCLLVDNNNTIWYSTEGKVGIDIFFTTTNMDKAEQEATAKALQSAISLFGTVAGTAMGQPLAGAGIATAVGGLVGGAINSEAANIGVKSGSILTDFLLPQTPIVYETTIDTAFPIGTTQTAYNHNHGRPSGVSGTLGLYPGYAEVETKTLKCPARATAEEFEEIKRILSSGCIV